MLKVFSFFIFCFIVCSCSDYNKQQAEKKAARTKESDYLNNEAKKMEDTIYKIVITGIDTLKSKQIKD